MAGDDKVSFTEAQWGFITKYLGVKLPDSAKPDSLTGDLADAAQRLAAVQALADDQAALGGIASGFDAGADDPAYLKAAADKLTNVAASIKAVGRTKPDTMSASDWDAHVKAVRGTAVETRGMWAKIDAKLEKADELDPALVAELKAMQLALAATLMEVLDIEPAHGPTNHVKLTQDGAGKRALIGVSPRDGRVKDKAKNATKFSSPNDFVKALDHARKSEELSNKIASVTDTSGDTPVVTQTYVKISLKLEDVFGPGYLDCVEGQTMVGSGSDRNALTNAMKPPLDGAAADTLLSGGMGVAPTDLTDGTITVGFMYVDGVWELSTMHPEVAKTGTQPTNPRPSTPELKYDRGNDQWLKKNPTDGNQWKPYDPDTDSWIT